MLALGAAFIATPALAQQPWQSTDPDDAYLRSDSGPPPAESGGIYNEAPGDNYYDYAQGPEAGPAAGSVAYCQARFRSYDPSTGMYRGFDGTMRPCP